MIKLRFGIIVAMCMFYTSAWSKNINDLFSETLGPNPTERHLVKIGNYEVSFVLSQGFTKRKSRFILSEIWQSDRYMDASCIMERKDNGESYFTATLYDYGSHYDMDSLMHETVGNLMPLFGDKYQSYWYNCGYLNGYPYVMVSDIASFYVLFPYREEKDMIKASFSFEVFLGNGTCFMFGYDTVCSRYNFQYEKVLDMFKSIEITKNEGAE